MGQAAAAVFAIVAGGAAVALAARPRGSRLANACTIFCFVSLTVVGLLTFELAAYRAPEWLTALGGASCATILVAWFTTVSRPRRGDGGRAAGPEAEPEEPWWWGDFERQLRAYERRQRTRGE
jgi:hypothetical protein